MLYFTVAHSAFHAAAIAAKESQGPKGLCMTIPEDDGETSFYLSEDMASGYALQGNTLVGVFAHATEGKGSLPYIMESAAMRLVHDEWVYINLDCFEPLAKVYARFDFQETGRVAFDWAYAPEGWTEDMGEPAVVFMKAHVDDVLAATDVMLDRMAA